MCSFRSYYSLSFFSFIISSTSACPPKGFSERLDSNSVVGMRAVVGETVYRRALFRGSQFLGRVHGGNIGGLILASTYSRVKDLPVGAPRYLRRAHYVISEAIR